MFKKFISLIGSIFFIPFKLLIKKKKVVILQTRNLQRYCDNSKYLYEFLSEKKDIKVYWVTNNLEIMEYIRSKGWLYISFRNPIHMIWIALRAKVIIDNGDGFFNIFNITNTSSVIKISCTHGSGPKATIISYGQHSAVSQILDMNKFNYVNFASKYAGDIMGKRTFFLPNKKIINFGYPRCDAFFDKATIDMAYDNKTITRSLSSKFSKKNKIILYTPTWRPYKYNFPLSKLNNFSFSDFDRWLELNNLIFFYTFHSNLHPENIPTNLDRVVFINENNNPLFDINSLMMEADILLNDYSTTSTDFSILNKPQVFYLPDYELYTSIKGFLEDYRKILPGQEVQTYEELKSSLLRASLEPKSFVKDYLKESAELQHKYYDVKLTKSTQVFSNFIRSLL